MYQLIVVTVHHSAAILLLLFREDPFTRRPVTITDVKFEMSCILYNIGALHSILGGMDSRQSPEVCFEVGVHRFYILGVVFSRCVF